METIPDLESAVESSGKDVEAAQVVIDEKKAELVEIDRQLVALRQREEDKGAKTRQLLAKIAVLDGKRRGIEATIDAA